MTEAQPVTRTVSPGAPSPQDTSLASVLLYAIEIGASDVHLSTGYPPLLRLDGQILQTNMAALTREDLHALLYDLLADDQRKRLERDKELDFAFQLGEGARFRVNCFHNMKGEGAAFRSIPTRIRTLEDLGLPPVLSQVATRPRGIVLVTGPTGSGKSTTLAAMVDLVNSTRACHILTIEDPIEFVHPPKRSLVNQRELGTSTLAFSHALRSALREDPDVILVGEMRDLETISLALTAAETGHLVFSTLHTQSAPKTCDRIIDVFPPDQQKLIRYMFAESFQAIICQQLLRRIDRKGRVAALEVMLGTPATRSLIREGKNHQLVSVIQTNQRQGMQTLDQHLTLLVKKGIVAKEEALEKANSPESLLRGVVERVDRPDMVKTFFEDDSSGPNQDVPLIDPTAGGQVAPSAREAGRGAPLPPRTKPAGQPGRASIPSWLTGKEKNPS